MKQFYKLKYIDLSDDHSYTEGVSRNHILHRWNSWWLYPDFATHLKNLVHIIIIIIKRLNSQLRNYNSNGYERQVLQKHFI